MSFWAITILGIYAFALFYITVYCVIQFDLLFHYLKQRAAPNVVLPNTLPIDELPFVTVQLPVYNEKYVVERLIDAVAVFDYPRDRFEIHILDDSTDETRGLIAAKVLEWQQQGVQISQITRADRKGFKAGALKAATPLAKGDFIAIFDADFLPDADFLRKTIPYFEDPQIGVVQTRWEHLNEDYSLITRMQAMQLNVHFTIEQTGRMLGNYLLQFNGTAGIWRKTTIEDAGGWSSETLTEDLDLSIRAQLKGWKIRFLESVGSPAELPAEMNSFKSQQFRWMKGGAETTRKMLPAIWRSNLSPWKKVQATVHLLGSAVFLFVFVLGLFSVPLLLVMEELRAVGFDEKYFTFFLTGLVSIMSIYFVANVKLSYEAESFGKRFLRFLFRFPLFLSLSMGMALHNSIAVIQGFRGKKTPFVRTPKFNIRDMKDKLSASNYLNHRISPATLAEGLLGLYFMAGLLWGWQHEQYTFLVFHAMLAFGYSFIFYLTIRHLSLK